MYQLGTTVIPILCLLEWDSPRCSEHSLKVPPPRFPAPRKNDIPGFFTPIIPQILSTTKKLTTSTPVTTTTALRTTKEYIKTTTTGYLKSTTTSPVIFPSDSIFIEPETTIFAKTVLETGSSFYI